MMMNRTLPIRGLSLLLACVVSLSVFPAAPPLASQSLPPYVMRAIDTSLSAILMTRDDMKLRWDRVPDDRHRLSLVKRMFEQPLICFALADTLGNVAEKGLEEPALLFKQFAAMLDLKDDLFSNPRLSVTDRELRSFAKVDLDSVDFAPAFILRRFLTLTLAADVQMYNARTALIEERLQGLVSYCDSLVLQSEGGGEATPVEMRMAERYGLARAKRFFNTDAADIDYAQFISPGANLFISGLEFARNIAPEVEKLKDSVKTRIWNTRLGRVAIGGPGDDVYTGNFYCIIDVGGNDVYKPSPRTKEKAADRGVSLVVDFSGNDSYIGGDFDFGGTLFGASVLIDMKGDDSYSAGNFALGAGYFGTGVLYDAEGSDRYVGGTAVEGAGLFGIGLLIDQAGNDVYQAHLARKGLATPVALAELLTAPETTATSPTAPTPISFATTTTTKPSAREPRLEAARWLRPATDSLLILPEATTIPPTFLGKGPPTGSATAQSLTAKGTTATTPSNTRKGPACTLPMAWCWTTPATTTTSRTGSRKGAATTLALAGCTT
ncbi:MAG: hypothetical protein UZ07_CHB004003064 [Chlorobi bacterium OLB7]|nr:MAG: hypothetical protein UZ07_CHB004003064 [Chlorobi bacterium OLB7]